MKFFSNKKYTLSDLFVILKGGPGSGHWGHAGRPGDRGGSAPKSSGMSLRTGRDASRRQQAAKTGMFYKGNLKEADPIDIFNASSKEVQALALETGVLATDQKTFDYLMSKKDYFIKKATIDDWEVGDFKKFLLDNESKYKDEYLKRAMSGVEYDLNKPSDKLNTFEMNQTLNLVQGLYYSKGNSYIPTDIFPFDKPKDALHYSRMYGIKVSNLTSTQRDILQKIHAKMTKGNGVWSKGVEKVLNSLSPDERKELNQLGATLDNYSRIKNYADSVSTKMVNEILDLAPGSNWYNANRSSTKVDFADAFDTYLVNNPPGKTKPEDYIKGFHESSHYKDFVSKASSTSRSITNNPYEKEKLTAIATVTPQEQKDRTDALYKNYDTATHGSKNKAKVNEVFRIIHPKETEKKYQEAVKKYGNVTTGLYHGSDYKAAQGINATGFIIRPDPKAGRMLGDGIYLADKSSKSLQYIGANYAAGGSSKRDGILFENKAAMGQVIDWNKDRDWRNKIKPGVTIYGPKGDMASWNRQRMGRSMLYNDEWSVADPSAVVPTYWIDATYGH